MIRKKMYLQSHDMLLNAIHDLAWLQKAEIKMCNSTKGIIHLLVTLYTEELEYHFTVAQDEFFRGEVTIELSGSETDKKRLIDHEFALLDYVLLDRAKTDLAEIEEWDRKIEAEKKQGGGFRGNDHSTRPADDGQRKTHATDFSAQQSNSS